jgi:hypothetical protein
MSTAEQANNERGLRMTVIGSGEYVNWCSPFIFPDGLVVGTAYGTDIPTNVDPNWRVSPLPKVICAFPGMDTKFLEPLVRWMESCGADVSIDLGPKLLSSQQELDDAVRMTQVNLDQKRYYIGPCDPKYLAYLYQSKIPYALLLPDHKAKTKWSFMLNRRGVPADQIQYLKKNWDSLMYDLHSSPHFLLDTDILLPRYPITIENDNVFVNEVPEYLKPESTRTLYHVASFHTSYDIKEGVEKDGKEPIAMVGGEVYGRVKEHKLKLWNIRQ